MSQRTVTRISPAQWAEAERHNARITTTLASHTEQIRYLLRIIRNVCFTLAVFVLIVLVLCAHAVGLI